VPARPARLCRSGGPHGGLACPCMFWRGTVTPPKMRHYPEIRLIDFFRNSCKFTFSMHRGRLGCPGGQANHTFAFHSIKEI
jgi:hypothetical protein